MNRQSAIRPRFARTAALGLAAALLLALSIAAPRGALAQTVSLSVDPSNQTVSGGQTFEVEIVQNVDVPTAGVQVNLVFDAALVQVVSVEAGPAYAEGLFLVGVSPQSTEEAIAEANQNGTLRNITTFIVPGSGSVLAGENVFAKVTMQGRSGGGGTSPLHLTALDLSPMEALDENGNKLPITAGDGQVVVTASAGGATSATPTAAGASATPRKGSPTPTRASGSTSGQNATVSLDPATQNVASGAEFMLDVLLDSGADVSSAEMDIHYDADSLQIVDVSASGEFEDAKFAEGEETEEGILSGVGVLVLPGSDPVAAGKTTLFKLKLKSLDVNTDAAVTLTNVQVSDADGNPLQVTIEAAEVIVGEGGGGGGMSPFIFVVGGVLGVGALAGVGFTARSISRKREDF